MYRTKNFLEFYLKQINKRMFFLFVVFLLCIFIGILTASNYASIASIENISDKIFYQFICLDLNMWGMFFAYLAIYAVIVFFIILSKNNLFCIIVDFVFLCISGYLFGFDVLIIFSNVSFLTIILFSIFYVLLKLVINFIMVIIMSISLRCWHNYKKYGKSCFVKEYGNTLNSFIFFLIMLFILILFIQCIFLSFINFTQIIES